MSFFVLGEEARRRLGVVKMVKTRRAGADRSVLRGGLGVDGPKSKSLFCQRFWLEDVLAMGRRRYICAAVGCFASFAVATVVGIRMGAPRQTQAFSIQQFEAAPVCVVLALTQEAALYEPWGGHLQGTAH